MARAGRDIPPPLELLCLKALWSLEEGCVRDVQLRVAVTRPLAYTTIMTVLDRLVRKGKLSRRKVGRSFLYLPQASREAMRHVAVRELLADFFDGSERELTAFLQSDEWRGGKVAAAIAGGSPVAVAPAAAVPVAAPESSGELRLDTALL